MPAPLVFELDLCWVKNTVDADMEGSKAESALLSLLGTLKSLSV